MINNGAETLTQGHPLGQQRNSVTHSNLPLGKTGNKRKAPGYPTLSTGLCWSAVNPLAVQDRSGAKSSLLEIAPNVGNADKDETALAVLALVVGAGLDILGQILRMVRTVVGWRPSQPNDRRFSCLNILFPYRAGAFLKTCVSKACTQNLRPCICGLCVSSPGFWNAHRPRPRLRTCGRFNSTCRRMASGADIQQPPQRAEFLFLRQLPARIANIAFQNKAVVYDLIFNASSETMLTIARDPMHLEARVDMTSVLHTWGSATTHHPHVHIVVPGGGISTGSKRWVTCRRGFF
jgi:hypothetical protein